MTANDLSGFDVIGDVHGYGEVLERLLRSMGYRETGGAYRHPERQAVFVGDLVDRGPDQRLTIEVVRRMVDAGTARIVMGNHEFNAIAWTTPDGAGDWCRVHSSKNLGQHQAFLTQIGEGSPLHREVVEWFRTLPLWLDLGGLRIVHACWDPASMAVLGADFLTDESVVAEPDTPHYDAIETVLKGPELDLGGRTFRDPGGACRARARQRWWDPTAASLGDAAELPGGVTSCDGSPFEPLPDAPLPPELLVKPALEVPVLYGHYWRSGPAPAIDGPMTACVDWSVAAVPSGPLVAYRWSGESELTDDHLVAVR